MTHPQSHLFAWYQKLKPDISLTDHDPFTQEPLLKLFNIWEASHTNNWGWDTDGMLYSVDIEVIRFENHDDVIDTWATEHSYLMPTLT